jgi:DUF971 family protein
MMEFVEGEISLGPVVHLHWHDGRRQRLSAPFLRANCRCEVCKTLPLKLEASMFPGLSVDQMFEVGAYALQFLFSDGHRHGAYSFDLLLSFPDEA